MPVLRKCSSVSGIGGFVNADSLDQIVQRLSGLGSQPKRQSYLLEKNAISCSIR